MVTLAPELENAPEVIRYLTRNNVTVSLGIWKDDATWELNRIDNFILQSIGHSMGSLVQGEEAIINGASFITHLFNAMLPVSTDTQKVSIELLTTGFSIWT